MIWKTRLYRGIEWHLLEDYQHICSERVKKDPSLAFLLLSEPRPTFTHGRSANPADFLWSQRQLSKKGGRVAPVTRGGKWTFHGPGQILVYPIVHLHSFGYGTKAAHAFLLNLRRVATRFLKAKAVAFEERRSPFGIYVYGKKLVSFGVAIHQRVSNHGFALYLTDQTVYFSGIHPCGVVGERVTSLEEIGVKVSWMEAADEISRLVKTVFKARKSDRLPQYLTQEMKA